MTSKASFKKLKSYLNKENRKDHKLQQVECHTAIKQASEDLEGQPRKGVKAAIKPFSKTSKEEADQKVNQGNP